MIDKLYTYEGTTLVDGNLPEDRTLQSALMRLLCINRGKWPADRAKRNLGSDLYLITRDSTEQKNLIDRLVQFAFEPYIKTGKISNVEVVIKKSVQNAVYYSIVYTNNLSKSRESMIAKSTWKE